MSYKGAAYWRPKAKPDYSPRDKRVWLRICLHRDCPADRCLEMKEAGDSHDG